MAFGTLEILAIILIVASIIKLIVVLISPKAWLKFVKKIYIRPEITSVVALLLSATVLYFLVSSGVTIVQILAVTLFIALLMTVGIVRYAEHITGWLMEQDLRAMLKELWLYTLIWIALLVWGIKAIFFS